MIPKEGNGKVENSAVFVDSFNIGSERMVTSFRYLEADAYNDYMGPFSLVDTAFWSNGLEQGFYLFGGPNIK